MCLPITDEEKDFVTLVMQSDRINKISLSVCFSVSISILRCCAASMDVPYVNVSERERVLCL